MQTKEKNPCLTGPQTMGSSDNKISCTVFSQGRVMPCTVDYNGTLKNCQDTVNLDFQPRKEKNLVLSESYKRLLQLSKSDRVKTCGDFLEFHTPKFQNGEFGMSELKKANFCRDRLCPLCNWRKSKKMYSELSQVIEKLGSEYEYLLLTLTVPNCWGSELNETVNLLFSSFKRLCNRTVFKNSIQGFFRALEITVCDGSYSPDLVGSYHPHFHCILAVKPSYFKKGYITQKQWLEMWRESTGIQDITQVDIRKVKKPSETVSDRKTETTYFGGIKEVSKYAVKDNDFLVGSPSDIDLKVSDLSLALKSRRLVHYGGIMKKAFSELGFVSVDNDEIDLCDSSGEISKIVLWIIHRFRWGIGCYDFFELDRKFNDEILNIEFSED